MLLQQQRGRFAFFCAAGLFILLVLAQILREQANVPLMGVGNASQLNCLQDIRNATLGFQKIFVINLPHRTDHRDAMSLAAAFTGLDIQYVDGVLDVNEKALPPGGLDVKLQQPHLGNWRAHTNIARLTYPRLSYWKTMRTGTYVSIRIKDQMQDFAKASHLLVQPMIGTSDRFLDPSHPQPSLNEHPRDLIVGKERVTTPTTSPYGDLDRWDLLWLGHCGTRFPRASDINAPLGRAIIPDDETVPETQHIHLQFGNDELVQQYPAHTRVVSRARMNTCTLGYALSLPGARRLLYEFGIHKMTGTTDMMLRPVCDGVDGRTIRTCLTVQPQLFLHHRPVGPQSSQSDIDDHGSGYNQKATTQNIRWSVRVNFPQSVNGSTNYTDQFKDGEESTVNFR